MNQYTNSLIGLKLDSECLSFDHSFSSRWRCSRWVFACQVEGLVASFTLPSQTYASRWSCLDDSVRVQQEYDVYLRFLRSHLFSSPGIFQWFCLWRLAGFSGLRCTDHWTCLHHRRATKSLQSWAFSSVAVVAKFCHFCRRGRTLSLGTRSTDLVVWLGRDYGEVSRFLCPSYSLCGSWCLL